VPDFSLRFDFKRTSVFSSMDPAHMRADRSKSLSDPVPAGQPMQ
jgi:hypothetical protein